MMSSNRLHALFAVLLLIAGASAFAADPIKSVLSKDSTSVTTNDGEFLKPDEAFKFSAETKGADAVRLNWVIAEGYYLYRDQFFKVELDGEQSVQLGAPQFPEGQVKEDEFNGKQVVFHKLLDVTVPIMRGKDSPSEVKLKVTYQGCAEKGLCYPPMKKSVSLALPSIDKATSADGKATKSGDYVSEQDSLAASLQGDNLLYALALFFGAGFLLSLTPCVLPMIPILSGIIVGQGENITRGKSFSLAFTYVQGMALTYAAAGAISALVFKQAPQAFFQHPAIVIVMTLLFIALAFAMFGAYTLQLPSALQTKLTDTSNKQKSGTFIGTFIMGALSALVVTACVAPAIVAALSVIIQSRQIFRGALALYASGIGMGIPLLVVGASAGDILPRAGVWMDTVKQLFGVVFLGVAVYMVQPLIPPIAAMLLWAALAGVSGFWLVTLMHGAKHAPSVIRGFGLLLLVYGIALLVGALAGRSDPLQPLAGLGTSVSSPAVAAGTSEKHSLPFKRIKTNDNLESEIAAAKSSGKTVMLDFYATWCTSCKEMEKYTFTDNQVAQALANTVWLQADVTANDNDDQALLKRFGIIGPPSIMFFGTDGAERKNFRVVGYMKADKFASHVQAAFAS